MTTAGGIAFAHVHPLGDAPAGRAIAVGGIVGAGLVGDRVGADSARDHFGEDFGGVAEQADAGRDGRLGDDVERFVDAGRAMVEVARGEALLDRAFLALRPRCSGRRP